MRRDKKVSVRMTSTELTQVRKKAESLSLSLSRYLLLQGLERPVFYRVDKRQDADGLPYQFAMLRNSLEKCMRLLRQGKGGVVEVKEMELIIEEIRTLLLESLKNDEHDRKNI